MQKGSDVIILSQDEAGRLLSLIRTLEAGVRNDLFPFTKDELIQYRALDCVGLVSDLKFALRD